MKKLISFCMFFAAGFTVAAQNRLTDTSATCVAYWKNKEKKVYVVNHAKEKKEDNKLQSQVAYSYEAHIIITDSTEEGYTLEWKNRNYQSDDPNISYLNTFFKDLKFVYKTDGTGSFLELLNWEEVREVYLNLAMLSIPKDNDTAQAILEKTKALFGTQEAVENTLIKDVQLFHTFFGNEYGTRKQVVETTLPNAFGGQPIPALHSIQVTRLQKADPTYTVRATQEVDRINGATFINELMQHFGIPAAQNDKELQELFNNFGMNDETEMDLQINSGWPARLQFKRIAKMMNILQTETYHFSSSTEPEAVHIHVTK